MKMSKYLSRYYSYNTEGIFEKISFSINHKFNVQNIKSLDKRFKDIIEIKKGINNIFDKDSISYKVSDNEPLDIIKLNSLCFKEVKNKILKLLEKE